MRGIAELILVFIHVICSFLHDVARWLKAIESLHFTEGMSVKLNKPLMMSWKLLIGACLLTATVTMCLMKWTNEKTMKIEEPKTNKWKIAFILIATIWII